MDNDFDPGLADDITTVVVGFAISTHDERVGAGREVGSDGIKDVHLRHDTRCTEARGNGTLDIGSAHGANRREAFIGWDLGVGANLLPPSTRRGVIAVDGVWVARGG